jgi:hypothetical protein
VRCEEKSDSKSQQRKLGQEESEEIPLRQPTHIPPIGPLPPSRKLPLRLAPSKHIIGLVAHARLQAVQSALDDFEQGKLDVERLQSFLEAEAAALDNSTPEMLRELRSVDAELESIRFTLPEADQRGEALRRLERTREILHESLRSL